MMDRSIDFSKIAYATPKSKLRVKTKEKLDEIAAQVELWNQEIFIKRKQSISREKRMNSRKSRVIIEDLSKPFSKEEYFTPPSKELPTKTGSVLRKALFFESLSTPQKEEHVPIRTPFKKMNKTQFFESLATPNKEIITKSVIEELNKENMYPDSDPEESLPPPPPCYYSEEEEEAPIQPLCVADKSLSESLTSADLTQVSPLHESISLLQEFYDDFKKMNYMSESESMLSIVSEDVSPIVTKKTTRRSLSWSEKLEYRENTPSETEHEEATDESDIDDVPEYESASRILANESDLRDEEEEQESEYMESEEMSTAELDAQDLKMAANNTKRCAEELQRVLNKDTQLGGSVHTSTCIRLIEATLRHRSVAERANIAPERDCAIEGYLELSKIKLSLKPGYVFIDYESLEKCNRQVDLRRIKKLDHVILFLRLHGNTTIRSSCLYAIVHESEARKLCLPHDSTPFLEMFEYVRLSNLAPECVFDFQFYSLSVWPRRAAQHGQASDGALTPFKKLLGSTSSLDAHETGAGRWTHFTHLGSFTISIRDLRQGRHQTQRSMNLVNDCPFVSSVHFITDFTLALADPRQACHGRLNVYSDVAGIGSWSFYDCELGMTSLCGWSTPRDHRQRVAGNTPSPHLEIPFHLMMAEAQMCDYTVCAKPYTFSVCLDTLSTTGLSRTTPHNRRMSADGKNKTRFMAEAQSYEHAQQWCHAINYGRESLTRWTNGGVTL